MKSLSNLFLILCLVFIGTGISAQSNILDEIIRKNTGKEGMSEVEISKKMLQLMLQESDDAEAINLLKNFESLSILVNEATPFKDPSVLELRNSLEKNSDYERLMYMKEDDEMIALYTKEQHSNTNNEKVSGKILHFVLIAEEDDEEIIMSIKGTLTLKEIFTISALLDYDLSNVLPLN